MRQPGWEARLSAHVQAAREAAFSWGEVDCCTWVCDGLRLVTGVDPMAAFRGLYTDSASAAALLRRQGAGTLPDTAAAVFGGLNWPEIEPRKATSGDVGIIKTAHGPALTLCWAWAWLAKAPTGLIAVPLGTATRAWRVG